MTWLMLIWCMMFCLVSSSQEVNGKCMYSFFFLAFRQPVAAKMAFLRVKSMYPESPVYIYSDRGGIDLSGLCTGDPKCKFSESPVHNGHAFDSYKKRLRPEILERAKIFMTRFREAAEWGGCEYMLYVEEDVWIEKPITADYVPVGDNGGIFNPWYPVFTWPLQEYIRLQTGQPMEVKSVIYGASYYRTDALIDAMDNHWDKIDWMQINELDGRIPMCWDTIPPILFVLSGYKAHYWNGACEKDRPYNREFAPLKCTDVPLTHKRHNPAHITYIHWRDEGTFNATMERMGGRVMRDHTNDLCFQNMQANYSLPCPVRVE